MTVFTSLVTYAWPTDTRLGGCSLTPSFGTIHETAGSVPWRAAVKKFASDVMFRSCRSCRTVVK